MLSVPKEAVVEALYVRIYNHMHIALAPPSQRRLKTLTSNILTILVLYLRIRELQSSLLLTA